MSCIAALIIQLRIVMDLCIDYFPPPLVHITHTMNVHLLFNYTLNTLQDLELDSSLTPLAYMM